MNRAQLCYFVGNANGRGLVRIEIDHRSEGAGFHVCSATRGKEAWVAALVDRWNAHVDLVEALEEQLGPKMDLTDLICHRGITTPEKCGRCSREIRAREIIARARRQL